MTRKKQEQLIDLGRAESAIFEPTEEVRNEFEEAAQLGSGSVNTALDQSVVDELGKAVGLLYEDGEPLHTTEKLEARDKHRWELDPASSEGFDERMKHEGEYEEK
mgnify:CR=1 FL=1